MLKPIIFTLESINEYKTFLDETNLNLDIYYTPEFLQIDADLHKGIFEVFTFKYRNKVFIYPYIRRSISSKYPGYYDITSPYGYCGPFCNDDNLFLDAEKAFIDYAKAQNIVTEFVRYHYIYNRERYFKVNIENSNNRTLVVLNTSQSLEDIWTKEFSKTNRNLVRKLEKEGYEFQILDYKENYDEFYNIYLETMVNASASSYYFFAKSFFQDLAKKLEDQIFLGTITKDGVTYCSSLFFASGGILTYYLSGRNLNFTKVSATNLLLSKISFWANQNSIQYLNLGGGLSNSREDQLFKFKSNFSTNTTPFFIGKRIHIQSIYNSLIRDWRNDFGSDSYEDVKNVLQFYRLTEENNGL